MRTARFPAMHRVVVRARDAARRTVRSLPVPVRTRLRGVIAWSDRWRPAPMIEVWSGPLIGPRSRSAARNSLIRATVAITGPDVVSPTRSPDSTGSGGTDLPALRCLLVTCALDVGGLDEMVAFL